MKRIFAAALTLFVAFALQAQEIPERKQDGFKPHGGPGKMQHHRPGGMEFRQLNLTDAQKEQMKAQREGFRKQMEELKKNDNITVKEWKSRMENLRKDQRSKMENILTNEQKSQLDKMKTERRALNEVDAKARMEKMKIHLGLTQDQSAKMEKYRKETGDKMKALRENKSMSIEKKREEMKELMKRQKENMHSILTEDQLKKMKESRQHDPHKGGKRPDMKKEII